MFCRKVLLAYDGTDGANLALEKTIELSKLNAEMQVLVLHVNQPEPVAAGEAYMIPSVDLLAELETEAKRTLEQAVSRLAPYVVCTGEIITDGSPASAIVSCAEHNQCDLIIIGNRGLSGLQKFFLGSVSKQVVKEAPVPVLVVKH
ncbi:universal stress protein [Paenibacillus allorhizosphaerae]|uniref:TRAP-T-associated universal stress protein TeaD n=1 Tax=Paenibacillus allorhizosphaerae TaxID=2849866 RepID=A0ABM8VNW1_9BACL|nr:universal stress protein [Paenibacillus allorhizosphaerae]CAG7652042.1 TRAP-T-associated universal stress protein TeaD [Paenibacillus allorhizosphaerae]